MHRSEYACSDSSHPDRIGFAQAVKWISGCGNVPERTTKTEMDTPMARRSHNLIRLLGGLVALAILATLASGCPAYEDKYTGTYREVNPGGRDGQQAIQVDFFRFGENASAVVRFYDPRGAQGDPFDEENETTCAWTSAEEFTPDDEWNFRLYLEDSSRLPRSRILGRVDDGGKKLDISMFESNGTTSLTVYKGIRRARARARRAAGQSACDASKITSSSSHFPRDPQTGEFQAMPERANYEIENPVFVVSWLGVEPTSRWADAPYTHPSASTRRRFDSIPPRRTTSTPTPTHCETSSPSRPAPGLQMRNGDTALALGHFSVVDDSSAIEDYRPRELGLQLE